MDTITNLVDTVGRQLAAWGLTWTLAAAIAALALVVLLILAHLLRRLGRGDVAKKVTVLATALGLSWSAQGMWDAAVNRYHQPGLIASVLFVVFEAWLMGRMLRAHEYRKDYVRRGKFVRAVWTGACVMAFVVATGEGWAQAPGRLAIPLLVTYGWYTDLTADDDPAEKPRTSLRWTPRRLALWIGMLEAGERDVETIDRDRLRDRLTRLAFRQEHGSDRLNRLARRSMRIARLKTLADDADLAEVRARLARMNVDLMTEPTKKDQPSTEEHPVMPPQPKPKEVVKPAKSAGDRLVQGVHLIEDKVLRGAELHDDGVARVLASVRTGMPNGMSNEALAALYTPPLGRRTAEKIGAEARRRLRTGQINGHVPEMASAE